MPLFEKPVYKYKSCFMGHGYESMSLTEADNTPVLHQKKKIILSFLQF